MFHASLSLSLSLLFMHFVEMPKGFSLKVIMFNSTYGDIVVTTSWLAISMKLYLSCEPYQRLGLDENVV